MTKILATWIIIQLLIIGMAGSIVYNEFADKTYDCSQQYKYTHTSILMGATIPLMFFVSDELTNMSKEYCQR